MGTELAMGMMGAGAVVGIIGQRRANKEQAKAERANAEMYAEQRRMSIIATRRELDIFSREVDLTVGTATNMFARAGIDVSGSALMQIANMKELASREYKAILLNGEINSKLLRMRENQARATAKLLTSDKYNNLQSLGTLLNAGSRMASLKSGSGDPGDTYQVSSSNSGGSSRFDMSRSPRGDSYTDTGKDK